MKNKIRVLFVLIVVTARLNAQTGGPGQPEFMQFQQAGTSSLVNPATGTFSYQIPLFTIGGYPMNLTYQSGIQMEDVSTMVGLGWNLNAGCIVRTLRGLPDDFDGDVLIKEFSVKPNETFGGKFGVDLEIAGLPSYLGITAGASLGAFYNNYKGWGLEPSLSGSISMSAKLNDFVGGSASLGMGVSVNSQEGVDKYMSPSVGLKLGRGNDKLAVSFGKTWSVNSNEGLRTSSNLGLSYVRLSEVSRKGVVDGGKKKDVSEMDQASASLFGLTSTSYLNNSFQPNIDYPFENTAGTYSGAVGWDAYYVDPNTRITGYYSKQTLATTIQYFPAYGSMYESSQIPGKSLMDFSWEKKLPYFFGQSKVLPIPYKTPDIFNLNAQGLSMTFSVNKNDIGVVGDADGIVNSNGSQAGAEVNLGELFKAGANLGTNTSVQQTGRWNPTHLAFKPDQAVAGNQLYQPFYFKNQGEINQFNNSMFALFGDYAPVQFNLANETSITQGLSNGNVVTAAGSFNTNQAIRQSTISYLTAKEAGVIGFDKQIKYYDFNNVPHTANRVSGFRKAQHLSEISVVQPDGVEYVFGLPVYDTTQKEVSFNVGANPAVDMAKNLVTYLPGVDNSVNNSKGIDHYFEATTTPAYVTQFLITAVLSPGYSDLTNDGITDDDLGNYVKFTYFKEGFYYNWRTPFAANQASYNKELRSDDQDDKGTYVFGTKELYYIRTVESKTEIAEFHYSPRNDGYGVRDENGGMNTNMYLRKLDSVVVYSLPDRARNGNNAVPIKTVHFDYNYSLANHADNTVPSTGGSGKLTLAKVDFTYEHSRKGRLTPYTFAYGNNSSATVNPDYLSRDVNKWGFYQSNNNNYSDCSDGSALSNIDYPYPLQKKTVMDANAYAWNLTDITIPGNGKLKVDYEAKDYAYIQDKTAGQMFMVAGLSDPGSTVINGNKLYDPAYDPINPGNTVIKNRIYFALTAPITSTNPADAKKELVEKYIQDIKDGYLYYKFYVKLTSSPDKYEYITGYTKISDYGVTPDHVYGYIDLGTIGIDDENNVNRCNPIYKTACQFMRINCSNLVFDNTGLGTPASFASFINSFPNILLQLGNQIAATHMGVNLYCETKGFCQSIDLTKSFIRLYNPSKMKIAGGSRVKQISIDDNWNAMTGNTHQGKSYTTTYDYTTEETDPLTNAKVKISSGVADYEPLTGGDEISLKQPMFYADVKKLAPDNEYYVEDPVDESLFPAPQITYGKVTQITNGTTLNVGQTGKIVNEFFTAKDYPVKVNKTVVQEKRNMTPFNTVQVPFVAIDQQHDVATISQGFSIELNNMSGLPKATWVYNQNGDPVSGEVSEYYPDNDHFTVIDRQGNILTNKKLGLTVEYTVGGQRSYDESVATSFNANLNVADFGPVFFPVFMPLYSQMTEEKLFQSIAVNKVIHRNGILKSKTVTQQSSSVTTENLAFDEVTGEALLTRLPNEFNDLLYSFKYPAWWMYDGMGPSCVNTKLLVNGSNINTIKPFLKPGDELRDLNTGSRLWVQNAIGPAFISDANSTQALASTDSYQVYNSGAKNMLAAAAGQVVTWKFNPLLNGIKIAFGQRNILNSSATEYYDDAVMYCDSCGVLINRLGKNDFLSGKKGNYRQKQAWFYLDERTPGNLVSGVTNIKQQGLFRTYTDFWQAPANAASSWLPSYTNWEWKQKVNLTGTDGQALETEDRIGRKAANLLGYKNTKVVAQAGNAGYGDTYFDGFEDYYCAYCSYKQGIGASSGPQYNNTPMNRVKMVSGPFLLSDAESHTGKYSIRVPSALVFTILPPVNCKPTDKTCKTCVGGFFPQVNRKYVFSCWVKVNGPQPVLSCSDASVVISGVVSSSVTLRSEGPMIEGWQRIMGTFTTLANNNNVSVSLNHGRSPTFFDDLRIFPADANMVSYVYDDVNLRLTYTLDENNYFSKNEYNNQGELVRTKKETEKGIVTIKEGNTSLAKLHQ